MERDRRQDGRLPEEPLGDSDEARVATLVDLLARAGVTHYYLSPGLRNAALIRAILNHEQATLTTVIDERAAAYQALGYARASGRHAPLVCTSGTALANYYPALIEAFASEVPLMVISADRPREVVRAGGQQCIDQHNIFGNFAAFFNLVHLDGLEEWLGALDEGTPLHINIPLGDPLGRATLPAQAAHRSVDVAELASILAEADNVLIVVGELSPTEDLDAVEQFLRRSPCPKCLDVTSSLKYRFDLADNALPNLDHPEVYAALSANAPGVVLHLGDRLTSGHYYRYLGEFPETTVIQVCPSRHRRDPAGRVNRWLRARPGEICRELPGCQGGKLTGLATAVRGKRDIIETSALSFAGVSNTLLPLLPDGHGLFLGNSTAIRTFDNAIPKGATKNVRVYANRGVSGIEGHIASAVGLGRATRQALTAVIGDISFLHDFNSLQALEGHPFPLMIVLVNDQGGGIFSLLPIPQGEDVLPVMSSPHKLSFEQGAAQFGLPYRRVASAQALAEAWTELAAGAGHGLLEVALEPRHNQEVYRRLRTIQA